jgi:hypothetical protein
VTHIYTCTGEGEYIKKPLKKYNNRKTNTYLIPRLRERTLITHMDVSKKVITEYHACMKGSYKSSYLQCTCRVL